MNNFFFNTIGLHSISLAEAEDAAQKQEATILNIFNQFSEYQFRTFDIEQLLIKNLSEINHDSVKRSITNLTNQGKLVKSEKAACKGPYGKNVFVWQYNQKGAVAA